MRQGFLWLVVSALPAAVFGQSAARIAPIPRDSLEMVTGPIQLSETGGPREAALQLLGRARNSYALRNLSRPWDLKVHFRVDSGGQTDYDGDWQMEDVFAPRQGLHWTAQSTAGFTISGIFGTKESFANASASVIPLRLQEARAMLYNPIPSVAYADRGSIRTSAAVFRGSPVTCILLGRARNVSNPSAQRDWDEAEECIDQQSGLLQVHSEAPGRYTVYDYTNAARLGSHILPRTITVAEGGRVVSMISVDSLQFVATADPQLFVPSDAMKAAGPAVVMTASAKISRIQAQGTIPPGTTLRPVCIFGLVTPAGHVVEAHSLQPSDPNSAAALHDAQTIDFSPSVHAGAPPQQHFVFVIEQFAVSQ